MPMPDLNTLRQYMDFYQSQFPSISMPGWNSGAEAQNARGAALSWAERMMNSQGGGGGGQSKLPDYFNADGKPNGGSYSPTPYREPQQFQPMQPLPQMRAQGQPGVHNFLAELLKMGPR